MSEELACLWPELPRGEGVALHVQQGIEQQGGGVGDPASRRVSLRQQFGQAPQHIHAGPGAQEVSIGQVRGQGAAQGGEDQQTGHQLGQPWQ